MSFHVGLDLGQSADYTALAVIEADKPEDDARGAAREAKLLLQLRHLERYPLRTPYTEIADKVGRLMRDPALTVTTERVIGPDEVAMSEVRTEVRKHKPELIVDNTGVGVAVTDLLKERGLTFRPVTITGGDVARASETQDKGRHYRVPKRDLVAALEVPFHNGTLKVSPSLKLWPTLREELLNFRRKINLRSAHDSYEHWRESDHDDLVLACALACWWARRGARRPHPVARRVKNAPVFADPGPFRREDFGISP
jgi:hypothetical protein